MPNAPFGFTTPLNGGNLRRGVDSPFPILKIMVKDKISLFAAAAGGFMLFVALSGILQGAPVTALRGQYNFDSIKVTDLQLQKVHPDEPINHTLQQRFYE